MVTVDPPQDFLKAVYRDLNLDEGELLSVEDASPTKLSLDQWVDKADWLELAKQVGAEKIFFVKDNPVIVFAGIDTQEDEAARQLFNRIWCMARPQHLFLAKPGNLAVYDLTQAPSKNVDEWKRKHPLALVNSVAEVAQKLKGYHRAAIESGKLPEEGRFGSGKRADQALVNDLKTVRKELIKPNPKTSPELRPLKPKYAHALIGRSIFIRYLEDRKVLDRKYFDSVASQRADWKAILDTPLDKPDIDPEIQKRLYVRVLKNKEFTYALFEQLSADFNGDMFPSDPTEKKSVDIEHLKLLQKFLTGDLALQQKLLFWAYKFDIIPIELISSIYEEFYSKEQGKSDKKGTHYTPSSLVRLLLSQVLTPECLGKKPRILDPCCGSGIFLVEAFRRIVRYRVYRKNGRRLSPIELRNIIRDQLAGIEINAEAIRIAAFSLYLAMLHFLEPPSIREQIKRNNKLPSLIYQEDSKADLKFNCSVEANAFKVEVGIRDEAVLRKFSSNCADVVIGNPPWGSPPPNVKDEALEVALAWCKQRNYPVGDKEKSQAFIWRSIDLLKEGGCAGLLVSNGIFFKQHENSEDFRYQWLTSVRLIEVINFSHIRTVFFKNAIAPFASVVFQKTSKVNFSNHFVNYFSAKETPQAVQLKAVVLSAVDIQRIPQLDFIEDSRLWKIYWWGNHKDYSFIQRLSAYPTLDDLCIAEQTGVGYMNKKGKASHELSDYKVLESDGLGRYGTLGEENFAPPPDNIRRSGKDLKMFDGERLLVKRGIAQSKSQYLSPGQIVARLETERFCFTHSVFCVKLLESLDSQYKIILGILWSSLARYYFFLTTSGWGRWHDEILRGCLKREGL
jgi:type I restriction-modification system DNA methylase subunit